MPRFDAFLDNSALVVRAALSREKGREWYLSMLPHLDDHGKAALNGWLEDQFAQAAE